MYGNNPLGLPNHHKYMAHIISNDIISSYITTTYISFETKVHNNCKKQVNHYFY